MMVQMANMQFLRWYCMIYTLQNTYFGKYQKLKVPNESSGPFPVTHSIIAYEFFQMHTLMNCSPIFHYIRTKIGTCTNLHIHHQPSGSCCTDVSDILFPKQLQCCYGALMRHKMFFTIKICTHLNKNSREWYLKWHLSALPICCYLKKKTQKQATFLHDH